MGIIYVGHGETGSGKTEVANHLEAKHNIHHYHPIGFMKRFEENLCGMPEGFLDSIEGKNAPVPTNEDKTMQEYMIALYHFYKEWMPGRSTLAMKVNLPKLLVCGDVCVVALRNIVEVETLINLRDSNDYQLITFSLYRDSSREETSDENCSKINDLLWQHSDMIFPIDNNGTIQQLQSTLDDIIKYG